MLPFLRITFKSLKRKKFYSAPKSLGEHIRRKRLELGFTQRQAGKRLGVSGWTVANWEKGHTKPTVHAYQAVFVFLGYYSGTRGNWSTEVQNDPSSLPV